MSRRRSSGRILSWLLRAGKVRTGPPRLSLPPLGINQTINKSLNNMSLHILLKNYLIWQQSLACSLDKLQRKNMGSSSSQKKLICIRA